MQSPPLGWRLMDRPAYALDFEKPLRDLTKELDALEQISLEQNINDSAEVTAMEKHLEEARRDLYLNLSPWQRVQLARHPKRPHALDYVELICEDFHELHGDRQFNDDQA